MKRFTRIGIIVLATTTVGAMVNILLVHRRLTEADPPLSIWQHVVDWVGTVLISPVLPLLLMTDRPPAPVSPILTLAAFPLAAAFWSGVICLAMVLWKKITEPIASPNGGPAKPLGGSGVRGGPPSVS